MHVALRVSSSSRSVNKQAARLELSNEAEGGALAAGGRVRHRVYMAWERLDQPQDAMTM